MIYIDEIAADIAGRVPAHLLPDEDTKPLFRLYALLALAKGDRVSAADVHDAWAVWMTERNSDHRSLKPFSELDAETRRSDEPFVEAIRAAAAALPATQLGGRRHGLARPAGRH
jgi:hypothetical protein